MHERQKQRLIVGGAATFVLLISVIILLVGTYTAPSRAVLRTLVDLQIAAEAGDLEQARSLCTERFLDEVGLQQTEAGSFFQVPVTLEKNYRLWRRTDGVIWLRPTDIRGPVYQFLRDDDHWRFDGLIARDEYRGRLRSIAGTPLPTP